jgi:DNA-binding MurR/RpiR family transcriptional regulator
MLEEDVRGHISKRYHELSNSLRKVADAVLQDLDGTAFLTAAELAERCQVSESSVTRFSMSIGYPGYPELQDALQSLVKKKLNIVERLSSLPAINGAPESTFQEVLQHDIRNLQQLMTNTEAEAVEAAVTALRKAEQRYVIGVRSTASLATFLGFYLHLLVGPTTILGNEAQDWSLALFDVSPKDAVVGISFPRYGTWTLSAFEFASQRAGTSIAITDGFGSPLARSADIVLPAPASASGFLESFVAPLSLINTILLLLGTKNSTPAMRARLDRMEELWAQTGSISLEK